MGNLDVEILQVLVQLAQVNRALYFIWVLDPHDIIEILSVAISKKYVHQIPRRNILGICWYCQGDPINILVSKRMFTTISSPASTFGRSNNSIMTSCCFFFLDFEPIGACVFCREGRSLPKTLYDATLLTTGASSVSVSLEDEMTWRLPGFLLGLYEDAIVGEDESL